MAATSYFLKIDGVDGESTDARHKGEIELLSFTWGESKVVAASAGGSGGGAGKVQLHDLHFVAHTSKASPQLLMACASGQHLKTAVLTVRHAGKDPLEFLVIKLADVLVTSYAVAGDAAQAQPSDQISLNFAQIAFDYRPQKADGSLDAAVHASWDAKANRKV